MKVHSYARNINLKGKYGKKYEQPQHFDVFENKTVIFFLSQMFYSPLGYLTDIMV